MVVSPLEHHLLGNACSGTLTSRSTLPAQDNVGTERVVV